MPAHTKRKLALVSAKTGKFCWYCGDDLIEGRMTVDHVVPKARGGHKKNLSNLVPCCYDCNQAKGSMTTEEYRQTLSRKTFYGERRGLR